MASIIEIKKGDHLAFQAVYDQYHAKLFHYFLKRTRSEALAKELTQQSFIKLWQSKHTLSEAHSVNTQFFTIASCIFIDHLRRQAVERKHQRLLDEDLSAQVPFACNSFSNYEAADYIDAVAASLPPGRKNVFMLKTTKGYSNKEIAEQLSVSVKTVEDHYSKALKQVRALLSSVLVLASVIFQN